MSRQTAAIFVLATLAACRPDPGSPDYAEMPDPKAPLDAGDFLEGPDPYQPGELRLSFGIFYEGGASQLVPIDEVSAFYYIYADPFRDNALTYDQQTEYDDRLEGRISDRILHGGGPWWGGGVTWAEPRDLSEFTHLSVSLRSGAVAFAQVELHMASSAEGALDAGDYGYTNDDTWHTVNIPLADFEAEGVDLGAVVQPLVFVGGAGEVGEALLVDNVYLSRE